MFSSIFKQFFLRLLEQNVCSACYIPSSPLKSAYFLRGKGGAEKISDFLKGLFMLRGRWAKIMFLMEGAI